MGGTGSGAGCKPTTVGDTPGTEAYCSDAKTAFALACTEPQIQVKKYFYINKKPKRVHHVIAESAYNVDWRY